MLLHAFGILCGFALVAFAAAGCSGPATSALAALAAVLSYILLPAGSAPDPVWGALGMLVVAAGLLWRPAWRVPAALGSGVAAAVWLKVLTIQGLPFVPGAATVLVLGVAVLVLSRRGDRFAPPYLIEEALLICAAFALVVACWPAVSAGYQSAAVFTATRVTAPPTASARWALQLCSGLLVGGGLFALWRRRT